ncbi:class I adenylate-forming enzyme family protein [Natrialbaceae archaeon A-CW1-1]
MALNFDLGIEDTESFVRRSGRFTVDEQLRKTARMHPDRPAVVELVRNRSITYAELDERVDRLGSALLELGLEPNDSRVAVIAENRGETVEVVHACARTGMLVTTVNWRLEREELVHCVALADADAVFVSERFHDRLEWLEADLEGTMPLAIGYDCNDDGDYSYTDVLEHGVPDDPRLAEPIEPEQGFAIINTSGTTGLPKGAVVSHRAELARAIQVTLDYELERGDNYPAWGPMFHMAGLDWIVVTAMLCGTYYPIDGFDPDAILRVLEVSDRPISWLFLVPGVLDRLHSAVEESEVDQDSFPPIRTMGALPDMIEPARIARITACFDVPFQNTYGSTEVGHSASGSKLAIGEEPTESTLAKVESPFGDVSLIDDQGTSSTDRGEMVVRGPALFSGYVDNEAANREVFKDGWYHTGDIFERNPDGTYSYVDRKKYLIKPGGENVYPAELETILIEHDAVEEVVVVRTDDPQWGEVPRVVVGTEQTTELETFRETLYEHLDSQLAGYKLPRYIEFVEPERFPRSTTGKIIRTDVESWKRGDPIDS